MKKVELKPDRLMYPRPIYLAGTKVGGKANFMAVGGGGVANGEPPMLCMNIRHHQYTLKGIFETKVFSINIPGVDLIKETDYCGIVSGAKVDKVADCNFRIFYGKLPNAPFIEQCPVNLGLRVVHLLNLGSHTLVIGEVAQTLVSEDCLTSGKPDARKIKAMIYTQNPEEYYAFGEYLGKPHGIGLELRGKA